MKKDNFYNVLKGWLPLAVAITLLSGLLYVSVQQNYRQNANDPQIENATDVVSTLNSGSVDPTSLNSGSKVDISNSLSSFISIFDENKKAVASNGVLNGNMPTPPEGTFDKAKEKGENRFTWQPEKGLRFAAVMKKYNKGYVMVARSLTEVENRVKQLTEIVFIGWVATMGASLVTALFAEYMVDRIKK